MSPRPNAAFDPITLEVLWSRLISIVDEAAATFRRSSFSTLVRDANDYAVVLMDADGNSVAQYTRSLPSFICTLPNTVRAFIKRFPPETLAEGDVILTNDPWIGTGHVHDISLAVPFFSGGRLLGWTGIATHLPDIGGRIRSSGIREIYEEGLQIPPLKLIDHGRQNDTFLELFRQNVRAQEQSVGDIFAAVAGCSAVGASVKAMVEQEHIDFKALSVEVQARTEAAVRTAIQAVPDGRYRYVVTHDGFEERVIIDCKIDIKHDRLSMDFTGTSPQIARAVNVVPAYTFAYATYGAKLCLAPEAPNNDGAYRPMSTFSPEGTVLNPRYPAASGARGLLGHMLPGAVMGALAPVMGGRVPTEGAGNCSFQMAGRENGRNYAIVAFENGGQGATGHRDGWNAVSFPSNLSCAPMEVMESLAPIRVLHRRLRRGSGGKARTGAATASISPSSSSAPSRRPAR